MTKGLTESLNRMRQVEAEEFGESLTVPQRLINIRHAIRGLIERQS